MSPPKKLFCGFLYLKQKTFQITKKFKDEKVRREKGPKFGSGQFSEKKTQFNDLVYISRSWSGVRREIQESSTGEPGSTERPLSFSLQLLSYTTVETKKQLRRVSGLRREPTVTAEDLKHIYTYIQLKFRHFFLKLFFTGEIILQEL